MQSVEPVLENAIKTLQKVVDVRGMGKQAMVQIKDIDDVPDMDSNTLFDAHTGEPIELIVSDFGPSSPSGHHHAHHQEKNTEKKEEPKKVEHKVENPKPAAA